MSNIRLGLRYEYRSKLLLSLSLYYQGWGEGKVPIAPSHRKAVTAPQEQRKPVGRPRKKEDSSKVSCIFFFRATLKRKLLSWFVNVKLL